MARKLGEKAPAVQRIGRVAGLALGLALAGQVWAGSFESTLRGIAAGFGGKVGLLVVELPSRKVLCDVRSAGNFIPASNLKLFTAHAALQRLGPEHRFKTLLCSRGTIEAGTLDGDLYLVGQGDPGLDSGTLYEMGLALRKAGVTKITGDLVADDSYFQLDRPAYVGGAEAKVYFTPNGALSLNYNTVTFTVTGRGPGQAADVWTETPGGFVRVAGRVATRWETNLRLSRRILKGGNQFSIAGSVAEGEREHVTRGITDATQYTLDAFAAVLGELGVAIGGQARRGQRPEDAAVLVEQPSKTVAELVYDMNKRSMNFIADQLALELGVAASGPPATWPKALAALQAHVAGMGLKSTHFQDGCGLSWENRTSPADLMAVLESAYAGPYRSEFVTSLPVAGRDGTLKRRMGDLAAGGNVRGKTGTITGASTLSGYVLRDDGRVLAYVILVNAQRDLGSMQSVQERLVRVLAREPLD